VLNKSRHRKQDRFLEKNYLGPGKKTHRLFNQIFFCSKLDAKKLGCFIIILILEIKNVMPTISYLFSLSSLSTPQESQLGSLKK
jgi:hypothetical protein